MKGIWTLALVVLAACPTAASAAEPRANPVSWEPPDARAGDPIDIALTLSGVGGGALNDVAVVLRGTGQTRRFRAIALGSGQYSATITFPQAGDWDVRVSYGGWNEIPLGKGGIRIDPAAPTTSDPRRTASPPTASGALTFVLVLGLSASALAASRSASRGSPAPPG